MFSLKKGGQSEIKCRSLLKVDHRNVNKHSFIVKMTTGAKKKKSKWTIFVCLLNNQQNFLGLKQD